VLRMQIRSTNIEIRKKSEGQKFRGVNRGGHSVCLNSWAVTRREVS
jgi:hypothetical protein